MKYENVFIQLPRKSFPGLENMKPLSFETQIELELKQLSEQGFELISVVNNPKHEGELFIFAKRSVQ